MSPVRVRALSGFDDPAAAPAAWDGLLEAGPTDAVFLTWEWQRAWWDAFGAGRRLLLLLAERDGRPVALAPLFADSGMLFFVGSGGSDYLDFVGDATDPEVAGALLGAARAHAGELLGIRLYHVPDTSPTGAALATAGPRLGLTVHDEGTLPAPVLDVPDPDVARAAAAKKSLVRHERLLRRAGALDVLHLRDGAAIAPHLDALFEQHVARWACTDTPSLFLDPAQRRFYRRLCAVAGRAGWLRFTRVEWEGRGVAHHFGACHRGTYLWYKPAFAPDLARWSPGEVLLRHLLLAAADERVDAFDFGLGDEAFKHRFASRTATVRTWGLYPGAER